MPVTVRIPRINANEDQLLVASLHVAPGQEVAEGELLAVVESTKAATEVAAPVAGTVVGVAVAERQMADVGADLVVIEPADSSAGATDLEPDATEGATVSVSAKARKRARELGVDIAQVPPRQGRVRVEDVEAFAAAPRPSVTTAPVAAGTPAVIIGGGGHAACLIDALSGGPYRLLGCTDAALPAGTEVLAGIRVLGPDSELERLRGEGVSVAFIGVGGTADNSLRRRLFDTAIGLGFTVPPLIHPTAMVGLGSHLEPGAQVLARASVGARCRIGADAIVNQGAIICHDSQIGDHVHLTPGAVIAGGVRIGAGTTVGMAATVLFGTRIGRDCLIHNGASVTGNVSDGIELTRTGTRHKRGSEA